MIKIYGGADNYICYKCKGVFYSRIALQGHGCGKEVME